MNDTTADPREPDLEILPPADLEAKLPAALGVTDAAIDELRNAFSGLVIVEGDDDSYKAVSEAIQTLSGYRTKIENRRKELKAPILDAGRLIDAEAKRLARRIQQIEDPLAEQRRKVREAIKARKEAAERAERDRLAKIQAGFDNLEELAIGLDFMTSDQAQKALGQIQAFEISEDVFQERTEEALEARRQLEQKVADYVARRIQVEAEDAERKAEEERLRKEREELEREKEALRQEKEAAAEKEREERIRQEERDAAAQKEREAAEKDEREKAEREEALGEIGRAREFLAELRGYAYDWTTDDRRVHEILNRVCSTTSRAITKAEAELLELEGGAS